MGGQDTASTNAAPGGSSGDELIDGDDGRRYWVPAMQDPAPSRKGTSLRWLLGAAGLVLVTLVVGVLVFGNALDGISSSKQATVVDDYARALQTFDRTKIGALACEAAFAQVQTVSAEVTGSRAGSKAERKGALHRDSDDLEHATVAVSRAAGPTRNVIVSVAKNGSQWCIASVRTGS